MISFALNLKSVSDVAVYSENGVAGKGGSTLTNGYRAGGGNDVNRKDLSDAFSAINQLPCKEVADLSGTFTAGVYCLASGDLSSRLVMDAQGNPNAVFVFRIAGGLNAKSGASIGLENDAQAGSVFFVANDTAVIGDGVDFKGNVFARNSIGVGSDTTVDGRVMSVKGEVTLGGGALLGPQQTGVLEICKEIDITPVPGTTTPTTGLENRLFRFSVAGIIAEVPVGQCSGPLVVPTGPQTITELQTGRTLSGGTFNGNFQLTKVRQLGISKFQPVALSGFNLPNFTANVVVREGGIANQIRIEFTNRFAIVAIVEICKEGLDSGVTGFFNFTINELRLGNTTLNPVRGRVIPPQLMPFTVPVGQCTGPIAVVAASSSTGAAAGPPRNGQVTINELPRLVNGVPAFLCTNVFTAPGTAVPVNRLIGFNILADGGCNATVTVVAGTDGGITAAGGTFVQTTAFFNNRTAPAALKICKIAGPGITVGSTFSFDVTGTMPLAPLAAPTAVPVGGGTPMTGGAGAAGGTAQAGATLQGGTVTTKTVSVAARVVENGGFCNDVLGLFVVGTGATITENVATANVGEVRVSRITSSSGITAPVTRAPGAPFFPLTGGVNTGSAASRTVTIPVTREVAEVEFVNIAFLPVPLKVCKIAGTGVTVGTPFIFTVTADTAGGLLAPFSTTVTIFAGPAAPVGSMQQNGFCDFVSGPFGGTFGNGSAQINGLNTFNFNSTVSIQETGFGSTIISAGGITSPTGGVVANVTTRTATIVNLINGINEVHFVNRAGTGFPCPPPRRGERKLRVCI
jgi:hypothetical protein